LDLEDKILQIRFNAVKEDYFFQIQCDGGAEEEAPLEKK